MLFVYNRLDETRQTIKALQHNYLAKESELIIVSDGPKNEVLNIRVNEVRQYIKTITGFKSLQILEYPKNLGLANSIIQGVTKIIEKYEKIIVLEDDLVTSPNFLDFMNQALEYYKENDKVQSINGFSLDIGRYSEKLDIYFHCKTYSWGWATWYNRWGKSIFDRNIIKREINKETLKDFKNKCGDNMPKMLIRSLTNKNDSWYASWAFNHFTNNKYAVYPYLSKVKNIGFDENATHCTTINVLKSKYDSVYLRNFKFSDEIIISKSLIKKFLKYFTFRYKLLYRISLISKKGGIRLLILDFKEKFLKNR